MVKKLRYYARFIVVCLLLKKMKLVRELVIELERQIQEYTSTYVAPRSTRRLSQVLIHNAFSRSYEPEDALEWALVLDEIKGFIKADAAVSVLHADSNPIVLSHRCVNRTMLFEDLKNLPSSYFVELLVEFHFICFCVVIKICLSFLLSNCKN